MQALYFAYGSNMASRRMRERAPGARAAGRARLDGWRLVADKPGRDGSAKLNLARAPGDRVWGVLWALDESDLAALDGFEGGYERVAVAPLADGRSRPATTYASTRRDAAPGLAAEYRALVVEGAREHGLPAEWLAVLEALPLRQGAGSAG